MSDDLAALRRENARLRELLAAFVAQEWVIYREAGAWYQCCRECGARSESFPPPGSGDTPPVPHTATCLVGQAERAVDFRGEPGP